MNCTAPWNEKLRAWNVAPAACALHNSVGFRASGEDLLRLGQWEREKARRFLKIRRRPEEGNFAYNHRSKHIIESAFHSSNEQMIHQRVLRAHHRWLKVAVDWAWLDGDGSRIYPIRELLCVRPAKLWPWSQAVGLDMDPSNKTCWRHCRSGPFRDCTDHFRAAFGEDWLEFAISSSPSEWKATERGFIDKLGSLWNLPPRAGQQQGLVQQYDEDTPAEQWRPNPEPTCRDMSLSHVGTHCCHTANDKSWPEGFRRWEFVVDNEILAEWCSARATVPCDFLPEISEIVNMQAGVIERQRWLPRTNISDWVTWRRRQDNKEADELANMAMNRRQSCFYMAPKLGKGINLQNAALQSWSDGGHR
eukprot:11837050-Karenia_brevis.AAC.1